LQWGWLFLTGQRGSRLIVDYRASDAAPTTPFRPIASDRASQPQPLSATVISSK